MNGPFLIKVQMLLFGFQHREEALSAVREALEEPGAGLHDHDDLTIEVEDCDPEFVTKTSEAQAAEEIERLLTLPVGTRRALYLLIHELGESFNSVPRAKHTKAHPPVKGSPR